MSNTASTLQKAPKLKDVSANQVEDMKIEVEIIKPQKSSFISSKPFTQQMVAIADAARKASTPIILWGEPGTGKTEFVNALAVKYDMPLYVLLGSTMDPTDVAGLPATQEKNGRITTVFTVPDFADKLITEGKGILFLDELSSAPPVVLAALLSLIQSRNVGSYTLPSEIWIIAAANAADVAANGGDLPGPMANRLLHLNWKPPIEDWLEGFALGWDKEINDNEREIRGVMYSYLKEKGEDILQSMPDDPVRAGMAWPSRRSWDNAVKVLANLDSSYFRTVLEGFIGKEPAKLFESWRMNLRLPSYDKVMNDPKSIDWSTMSDSAVHAILHIIVSKINEKNTKKSVDVVELIVKASNSKDIGFALSTPMVKKVKEFHKDVNEIVDLTNNILAFLSSGLEEAGVVK